MVGDNQFFRSDNSTEPDRLRGQKEGTFTFNLFNPPTLDISFFLLNFSEKHSQMQLVITKSLFPR
jgi:hypothetical protein